MIIHAGLNYLLWQRKGLKIHIRICQQYDNIIIIFTAHYMINILLCSYKLVNKNNLRVSYTQF